MISKIKKVFYHPLKNLVAKSYLYFLQKFTGIKVIAITGSAGKTTTKEMIASILRQVAPAVWSKDNIDPVYNIASTILKCTPRTKYLVLEMGVEYPGEMDFYLSLVKPDVGVITNIYPAHTEFFGDLDGVLKEKSKLVLNLSKNNVAVLNRNDKKLVELAKKIKARVEWFNGENNECAAVVGNVFGVDRQEILKGLETYERPKHRMNTVMSKYGSMILDDSYNSNPNAFLSTLKKYKMLAQGYDKIAVIGDMLELGGLEERLHRKVGKEVARSGFKVVVGVGKAVRFLLEEISRNKKIKTYQVSSQEKVLPLIKPYLTKKTYILVKGSRSIGLDKLVAKLV